MRRRTARLTWAAAGGAGALAVGLFVSAPASAGAPTTSGAPQYKPFTLAVYGDAPYGTTPTDTSEFDATPAFIDNVNADADVTGVIHVGDIHSGSQYCTQAYDQSIRDLWTRYQDPLVYTPGDNEWSDCHKKKEGGGAYNSTTGQVDYVKDANGNYVDYEKGDPVKNLDLVRSIFFNNPGQTLGQHPMQVESQGSPYIENVAWQQAGVQFVTLNIPGGSNDDADPWYGAPLTQAQTDERAARDQADLAWIDHAFALATTSHARAVVVSEQADMWDLDGKARTHIANYNPFVRSLAQHTIAFGKPVLLFNGDSHSYRSDNPLSPTAPCYTEDTTATTCSDYANQDGGFDVSNFHRITVHGSTFPLEWLKLTVHGKDTHGADSFGPFSWERIQP